MNQIPVLFTSEMAAHADSFSPSAGKPVDVVQSWRRLGVPCDFRQPNPVTTAQLCMAHEKAYVDAVLSCRANNGFGNRSRAVAESLPYTSGAMLSAARMAVENQNVAVAPCSGFHHAGWSFGGGYCTFNGLMVTACELRRDGDGRHIGILDFDQHWGNGTHNIIEKLNAAKWVTHYSPTSDYGVPDASEAFLAAIPELLSRFDRCDVVLYQAGADQHIDDPLGGWLTTDQLYRRDLAVFGVLKAMAVPVAWNLAGGYQEPLRKVLDIHDNTMRACHAVYAHAIADGQWPSCQLEFASNVGVVGRT